MTRKILIIGGVAAGMKTAARLRRRDRECEITVLERGPEVSYGACGFPYYIGGEVQKYSAFTSGPHGERDTAFFRDVKGVNVLTGHEALAIDRGRYEVSVLDKKSCTTSVLPYDKLVLATGSTPVKLNIPGNHLAGIHSFWFPQDVHAVRRAIEGNHVREAVIIGAGLVGLEMAEALQHQGIKVSIVEMQDRVLPQMLDKEMSLLVERQLRSRGVELYLGEKTTAFMGSTAVEAVETDKSLIHAQLVIVAVGVRPNVELAQAAGLEIGPSGCIAVDRHLRTSDPDIYAGGDCAENTHLISGAKLFAPMGSTANKHGRVIADVLTGDEASFPGILTTGACRVLGYEAGATGLNEAAATKAGIKFTSAVVPEFDRLGYMPGVNRVILKLLAETSTGKVIGAQAVGNGGVAKKIDTIAMSLTYGAHLEDLCCIDVAYAPPFNLPIDGVAIAASVLLNKLSGRMNGLNPREFEQLKGNPDYVLVDVRTPKEFHTNRIAGCANIINIPLPELRAKAATLLTDRNKKYVCSCLINLRGYEAETILRSLGYPEVYSLEGGMSAWPFATEHD